jgi:sialate O-acetylesterase
MKRARNRARARRTGLALALLSLLAGAPEAQELRVGSIFGDHMVLQRETQAPLWGRARPGKQVKVVPSFGGGVYTTLADENGRWEVILRTPEAGGPHTLTILSGGEELVLADVLLGEVWLASGQSNMEWPVSASSEADIEIPIADHPRIRLFEVAHATAPEPRTSCDGVWRRCTPESVEGFSAVGYAFGLELLLELDVPIGIVASHWGGTLAEAWTSARTLRFSFPEFDAALDEVEAFAREPAKLETLTERQAAWWEHLEATDPGARGGWAEASVDVADWGTASLPGSWRELQLGEFDGCLWYRREVDVPAAWAGRDLELELGPIDDMDTTWFGGERVGQTHSSGAWNQPRSYVVPGALVRGGPTTIVVRAVDTAGEGRMGKEPEGMRLRPAGAGEDEALPLAGTWSFRAGAPIGDLGAFPSKRLFDQDSPSALFNGMIAPLVPYAIRGAIWYQGESNRPRAAQYRRLFPALIRDWRAEWRRGDFPFYFVQIAPFDYGGDVGEAAELREAQLMTLSLPNTGMVVTLDIGDPRDIHPRNKREVGRRLALWALARDYGREDLVCSGPLYRSMTREGDAVRLAFDHAAGLTSGPVTPSHFTIAGEDRVFHAAEAVVDGETVLVRSDAVPAPVAVRFAWGTADEPNLRNGADLPASSFRTDDWPAVTAEDGGE